MKITANQDRERGAGHAVISITGLEQPERWTSPAFLIRRSDGKSLGQGEWQMGDMPQQPSGVAVADEALQMNLGPEVVDLMEPGNYKFTLFAEGLSQQESSFAWGYIPSSPLKGKQRPAEEARETPPPRPDPETAPEEDATEVATVASGPEPVPEPETHPASKIPDKQKKPFPWLLVPALVLILGLGGWLAWTYLRPVSPVGEPQGGARAQAQKALSESVSPQRALELARQMDEQGNDPDSAFLLYDYAAEKGEAAAALRLGNFYDPTFDGPSGSIVKDPAQAHRWYRTALQKDSQAAQQNLDRLRPWVAERAAQGDAKAKALLEQWQ